VDAALSHLGCDGSVLTIDPMTLEEVLGSINALGEATGRTARAMELAASLRSRLDRVSVAVSGRERPRVAIIEWTDPLFSAGHWVPDMVTAAGAACVLGASGHRSESITPAVLASTEPELIVVAPCGYRLPGAIALAGSFAEQVGLPPGVPVWAVDADAAYVRPGPRLIDGIEALAAICHPGSVPPRLDLSSFVGITPP
jgi:iron complex transport system substrate-binding protein